jgi:hypothetical protein
MIEVFTLRAQSRLMTGIEQPFDTRELDAFMEAHPKATVLAAAALDELALFVVVRDTTPVAPAAVAAKAKRQ